MPDTDLPPGAEVQTEMEVPTATAVVKQRAEMDFGSDDLRLMLECISEGVCALDREGNITFVNRSAASMLGLKPEEAYGKSMHDLIHHSPFREIAVRDCPICRNLLSGQSCHIDHEVFWRLDGTSFPVEYSVSPLQNGESVQGVVVTFADLTQRKIHAREMLYILASAQCLLLYADVEYIAEKDRMRWFLWPADEEAARRFLPFPIEPGQSFAEAYYACRLDEDKESSSDYGQQEILAGRSYRQEYRCRTTNGEVRWIAEDVRVERSAERRWRAAIVCTDITELKQREWEIAVLNERLQRAMTETHHRVKNNLQIIAAMIDLQTMDLPEALPLAEFTRLSRHVRTLAAVHEILTKQAKGAQQTELVSAQEVLSTLLAMIEQTAGSRRLSIHLEDAALSSRQGTSLALVTNELVANAIKNGKEKVAIRFRVQEAEATLEVVDDGPGFSAGFEAEQSAHTGLELVGNLVRWDLRGAIEFQNHTGTGARVIVRFPLSGAN